MQANTALSSLLAAKVGLRFKSPFPQIFLERIITASAGPKGDRQGWRRIKPASATTFLASYSGYEFIEVTH
jgi:hypothetical protein